jgi:hypothetical protein
MGKENYVAHPLNSDVGGAGTCRRLDWAVVPYDDDDVPEECTPPAAVAWLLGYARKYHNHASTDELWKHFLKFKKLDKST